MIKATEKIFMHILMSGRKVETHYYCEDSIVYFWEGYNPNTNLEEFSYLMAPSTAASYAKFRKKVEKECPLLLELV